MHHHGDALCSKERERSVWGVCTSDTGIGMLCNLSIYLGLIRRSRSVWGVRSDTGF